MANETVTIAGPVSVKQDSAARVAYDLMLVIEARTRDSGSDEIRKTEEYWLKLYLRCWGAVHGREQ